MTKQTSQARTGRPSSDGSLTRSSASTPPSTTTPSAASRYASRTRAILMLKSMSWERHEVNATSSPRWVGNRYRTKPSPDAFSVTRAGSRPPPPSCRKWLTPPNGGAAKSRAQNKQATARGRLSQGSLTRTQPSHSCTVVHYHTATSQYLLKRYKNWKKQTGMHSTLTLSRATGRTATTIASPSPA